jgi:2-dehydro-3-deoxygalactonokinase
MSQAVYGAVDWGTSSFRLWLINQDGGVLAERRSHEGMIAAEKLGFASVLRSHLDAVGAARDLPVVICGMAGARQGWLEAGYIDTPTHLVSILERAMPVPGESRDIRILPGLAQRDRNAPDVMRGEETQLLGVLDVHASREGIVCMPGTHSKWASVSGGTVERFSTFMTGELFDVVSRETILSHAVAEADEVQDTQAFQSAVVAAFNAPALATNLLFQVRSSQLLFGGKPSSARERISGTLIGIELAATLARDVPMAGITLVASGRLQALYRSALSTLSIDALSVDAHDAVLRGLSKAAKAIWKT